MFITCAFLFSMAHGAYYLSSNGSDAYSDLQAKSPLTPFKSIDRLNLVSLLPGDTVLFHRNDSFYGTVVINASGQSGNPLVFSSFGMGSLPVIHGDTKVTGWSENKAGLQTATFSMLPRMLFYDSRPLQLARFPNQGYRVVSDTQSALTFTDTLLDGLTNWTGARVHLRTSRWTIASKTVVSFNSTQKQFSLYSVPVYGIKKGWGYFLNNHLAALDTAGEWYYDSATTLLKAIMPDNGSASNHTLEAAVLFNGFDIRNKSFIVIESLTVQRFTNAGIYASGGSGLVLRGLNILDCDAYGICLNGLAEGRRIEGCQVYGGNTDGIMLYATGGVIENNRITGVALMSRLNASGLGDQCCSGHGFNIQGNNNIIRGNVLDSIGYIAINFGGQNTLIEYNFINHCCITKDDGAGIYTWSSDYTLPGSAGSIVRYNIVLNSVGAPEGTDALTQPGPANGIYMDDRIHDVEVYDNTTAYCARWGYQLHNNYNLRFTGNMALGCGHAQLSMNEDFTTATDSMQKNRISNNRFISTKASMLTLYATSQHTNANMGTFDSNYYWNPYSEGSINYLGTFFNLERWQSFLGQDLASSCATVRWDNYSISDTVQNGLIVNGSFESGITSWSRWPSSSSISWDAATYTGIRCLKFFCPFDGSQQPIAITNIFRLKKDSHYLLRFRVRGQKMGTLTPVVRQSYSPYASRAITPAVSVFPEWKDYRIIFTATATDTQCRVDFASGHSDSVYWLDDVSLAEVSVQPEDTGRVKFFYNPTRHDSLVFLSSDLRDLKGQPAPSSITLLPFRSAAFYRDTVLLTPEEPVFSKSDNPNLQIAPNPFNPEVRFILSGVRGKIEAVIYNLSGRRVAALSGWANTANRAVLSWKASRMPSGLYPVVIKGDKKIFYKTITLIK